MVGRGFVGNTKGDQNLVKRPWQEIRVSDRNQVAERPVQEAGFGRER